MARIKPKQKGVKQLFRERETARKKKESELKAHYSIAKKNWEELMEYRKMDSPNLPPHEPFESMESYVARRLEEWENNQPPIISGRYYDQKHTIATYQQKFIEFIRKLYPKEIEELKAFVSFFFDLFGEDKEKYLSLFATYKMEIIDLDQTLNSYIYSLIELTPIIQFRPELYENIDYQFIWGEHRILFHFLYLLLVETDQEKKNEVLQRTVNLLRDDLFVNREIENFPQEIDESALQLYISTESERIVNKVISSGGDYFAYGVKEKLARFLELDRTENDELHQPKIKAFIILQVELIEWAIQHNLGKDWILKYAYDLLKQFSDKPNLESSKIDIGRLRSFSLAGHPFEFNFNGWLAGNEDKEDYEARLRKGFEIKLEEYFRIVGSNLDLMNKTRITKPKDPEFESIKWLICWNEGATKSEIAKIFNRSTETIKDGIEELANYNLPIRIGKPGRKKETLINKERLLKIKSCKIGGKSTEQNAS
jgi:hypothetical protein